MTKAQKSVVSKWIAALRSGNYEQGIGKLRGRSGKFCCLGVLCDLAVKEGVIEKFAGGFLPVKVMEWAGLRTEGGDYSSYDSLSYDNDEGKSFEEIAAIIAKRPKNLFRR